ncbi:MAG: DUF1134 domain-containing protein [Novosphingobium sp.]
MTNQLLNLSRKLTWPFAGLALLASAGQGLAQVKPVDPDKALGGDLVPVAQQSAPAGPAPAPAPTITAASVSQQDPTMRSSYTPSGVPETQASSATGPAANSGTYRPDDVLGAAEGAFGKGAKGLAGVIKDILAKQGEPNGYIVGREGGAALVVGLRYGSGTLYHKIEGQKPVYWTGPSVGFDAGASGGNTFILVYNLYNTEDIYKRFGAGEGQAYLLGGFHVSYLRRGDVVLIPVRVGVGLRLGINVGYMKITKKSRILPF